MRGDETGLDRFAGRGLSLLAPAGRDISGIEVHGLLGELDKRGDLTAAFGRVALPSGDGSPDTGPGPRLATLTERDQEVLEAIALGLTNGEIAERFHLAESTVKTHVGRILAKIGARDRVQAVIFAYDTRLVSPTRPRPRPAN
ncbi:response regulator transcription factor [Actinomadura sp. 3N508]|uniref:response regulator transcription factor n=1 Tax=Actinomadura sp. 3N508 TaxID=3375153 RepID=UPI00379D32FB